VALRAPCLVAFWAVVALPVGVRGPVERVHGRVFWISFARVARYWGG
jgi:hypothetical protein